MHVWPSKLSSCCPVVKCDFLNLVLYLALQVYKVHIFFILYVLDCSSNGAIQYMFLRDEGRWEKLVWRKHRKFSITLIMDHAWLICINCYPNERENISISKTKSIKQFCLSQLQQWLIKFYLQRWMLSLFLKFTYKGTFRLCFHVCP